MNIYVYSDESGVFDKDHNSIFVFGGLVLIGSSSKEEWSRRYSATEKVIRKSNMYPDKYELKATKINNTDKNKLYRSLNKCHKFGVVINQNDVMDRIFDGKKDKQRYLDYAYKIAIKRAFQDLISSHFINPNDVERIYFYADEHATATNGCYELKEGLEQEFKFGTYNYNWCKFYPPIFPNIKDIQLEFCNSASKLLIRAADIVANKVYFIANTSNDYTTQSNLHITRLP